jgi:hypothetical protein
MTSLDQHTDDPSSTPSLRVLFPDLTDDELREAESNIERYLAIVLRIFERLDNVEMHSFDDPPSGSI